MKQHRTSRNRPIRRVILAVGLALVVAAGLAACDPYSPADCSKDCIDFVAPTDGGDQILLAAHGGAVTAEVTIYANSSRTTVVGYARNFDLRQYPTMAITKQYQALPLEHPTPVQLKGATTYWYKAKVTGAGSTWRTESASFKTKKRVVKLTATNLYVWDDSDVTGTGELTFHLRANGGTPVKLYQGNNLQVGYDTPVSSTITVNSPFPKVTIAARGYDDDCTISTCTLADSEWSARGDNGDVEWATATLDLSLPNTGATGTWKASTSGGGIGDLGFSVSGTYSVTYEYA